MPFKSKAQQGFMFAQHPKIAREWADKYGVPKNLPKRVSAKSARRISVMKKAKGK